MAGTAGRRHGPRLPRPLRLRPSSLAIALLVVLLAPRAQAVKLLVVGDADEDEGPEGVAEQRLRLIQHQQQQQQQQQLLQKQGLDGRGDEGEGKGELSQDEDDDLWLWDAEADLEEEGEGISGEGAAAEGGALGGASGVHSPTGRGRGRKVLDSLPNPSEWWRAEFDAPPRDVREGVKAGRISALYALGVKKLLGGLGCGRDIPEALRLLREAAQHGHAEAQSSLAFLHAQGLGVPMSRAKAFLLHTFAARNGSTVSKMALAYDLLRQQEYGQAVGLYAEVAQRSMVANRVPGKAQLVEMVRLNDGMEESRDATRFQKGEDDETIQYIEFTAAKGNVHAMRMMGRFLYWGARGMPRDHPRALSYFRRAAELGDVPSMLTLGEMLARGVGAPGGHQDPQQAMKWFSLAAEKGYPPAHNGIGFLYARGKGVPQNYTKAMEHFRRGGPDGQYNLGVMHLRGLGNARRRPNPREALKAFRSAVWQSAGGGAMGGSEMHMGALFYLARMHHKGLGTPQDLPRACTLFKAVAEQGPWGGLLRWAHDCYMGRCGMSHAPALPAGAASRPGGASGVPGAGVAVRLTSSMGGGSSLHTMGTAFLLYARAGDLGYEVAQSNAAWLLDRLGRLGGLGRQRRASAEAARGGARRGALAPGGGAGRARKPEPWALSEAAVASSGGAEPQIATPGAEGGGGGGGDGGGNVPGEGDLGHTGAAGAGARVGEEGEGGPSASPVPPLVHPGPSAPLPGLSGGAACVGPSGFPCTLEERQARAHRLWRLASEQGNVQATLLVGDAYFYGRGVRRSLEKAVEAYRRAKEEKPPSAQACFNLGFMHERGLGLPPDLHLAKRYYDEALSANPRAVLPISLALAALWLRLKHPDSILVRGLDALPEVALQLSELTGLVLEQLQDEGNRALLTLLALLGAVLYLRAKLRRPHPGGAPVPPNGPGAPGLMQPGGPGFAAGPVH